MISIIITTYNYARYVERAIRSCLNQSIPKTNYEIIVVNDASQDYTKDILTNYLEEVRVFNRDKNIGLAAARNFGIKKAKGQFVVFIDADDYIQKDLLLIQSGFLLENNQFDAVSCDYFLINEREERIRRVNAEEEPIACGIMFRKDLLYDIGLYDESFRAREEEDLRVRFLKKYNIYNIVLPLYRYRIHGSNLTMNTGEMAKYKDKLNEKHKE